MTCISEKILEILKEGTEDTAFVIGAMLSSRPESYRRFSSSLRGRPKKSGEKFDRKIVRKETQNLYNILNHLKREGFIKKENKTGKASWSITKSGLSKLDLFKKFISNSKKEIKYERVVSKNLIIVAFDIPEQLRGRRGWLRDVLKYLNFSMIQQSVWIGSGKIPDEFVIDLQKRGILECVDIFGVGNKGTLQRLSLK